ncbi:MAG TPA: peptidoglycan-associated lipoprotein Pal [Candidatus Acidoferrales bacterium]|nr:peptidoglycan-associated lipoprotein Pal [Candidatus Acidoferrales bacterium]
MQSSSIRRFLVFLTAFTVLAFAGACKKKVAPPPPAPAPAPAPEKPTVTLNASQTTIKSGESTTLNWSSTNATDLDLQPGVGKVAPEGSTNVSPTDSTTYTITATGPGGTANATALVTVSAPPPPPPPAPAPAPDINALFSQNVTDAYFDFDKSDIRADAKTALQKDAEFLRSYPQVNVTIEGHCDERGSSEYNLGLGQRRADSAKQYLVSLGISGDRIKTMSWGKEHPFCSEHNEDCWQQNRRGHFTMTQQQ